MASANAIASPAEVTYLSLGQALHAYGQALGVEHPDYVESASEGMASLCFTVQGDPWGLKDYLQSDEADRESVERWICLNKELATLDQRMFAAYQALRPYADAQVLRQKQRQWLRTRNACAGMDCLRAA